MCSKWIEYKKERRHRAEKVENAEKRVNNVGTALAAVQ